MVSCQKGPTRYAYAWQIGPFWQDTLDMYFLTVVFQHIICLSDHRELILWTLELLITLYHLGLGEQNWFLVYAGWCNWNWSVNVLRVNLKHIWLAYSSQINQIWHNDDDDEIHLPLMVIHCVLHDTDITFNNCLMKWIKRVTTIANSPRGMIQTDFLEIQKTSC